MKRREHIRKLFHDDIAAYEQLFELVEDEDEGASQAVCGDADERPELAILRRCSEGLVDRGGRSLHPVRADETPPTKRLRRAYSRGITPACSREVFPTPLGPKSTVSGRARTCAVTCRMSGSRPQNHSGSPNGTRPGNGPRRAASTLTSRWPSSA